MLSLEAKDLHQVQSEIQVFCTRKQAQWSLPKKSGQGPIFVPQTWWFRTLLMHHIQWVYEQYKATITLLLELQHAITKYSSTGNLWAEHELSHMIYDVASLSITSKSSMQTSSPCALESHIYYGGLRQGHYPLLTTNIPWLINPVILLLVLYTFHVIYNFCILTISY